jgi:hypothetical protein
MRIEASQLKVIVEEHRKWLFGQDGTRAVLTGADLEGAYLTGADLTRADLTRADLAGADLDGADLTRADLAGADLTGADLAGADLTGADLAGADLTGADLTGAVGVTAPTIPNIDAAILAAIESPNCTLNMSDWHTCETTHCRAGWAVHLAGLPGKILEDRIGPAGAGALIYAASRPGKPIPNFYDDNEEAMADIRRCAAESEAAK